MTTDDKTGATPPAPAAAEGTTIADLKAEQDRQAGVLDRLLAIVERDEGKAHGKAQDHVESRLDRSTEMAEAMRQAVRDVQAEREAAAATSAHDLEHARLKEKEKQAAPETPPREHMPTWKERLQQGMFGGDR